MVPGSLIFPEGSRDCSRVPGLSRTIPDCAGQLTFNGCQPSFSGTEATHAVTLGSCTARTIFRFPPHTSLHIRVWSVSFESDIKLSSYA